MAKQTQKIVQGGAGTLALVAAPDANQRIVVHSLVVSLAGAGTVKLTDDAGPDVDLTGAFTLATGVPLRVDGPIRLDAEQPLQLVSTGAAAAGLVVYEIEDLD